MKGLKKYYMNTVLYKLKIVLPDELCILSLGFVWIETAKVLLGRKHKKPRVHSLPNLIEQMHYSESLDRGRSRVDRTTTPSQAHQWASESA